MTPKQQIAQLTAQLESRDAAIAELKAEIEDLSEGLRLYRRNFECGGDGVGDEEWAASSTAVMKWEARRSKRAEKGCGA